ncbi:MAG: hypothetical protein U1F83_15975 [Verrucomicrobiota bacterium]
MARPIASISFLVIAATTGRSWSSYTWVADEQLDGVLHGDYREKRGGAGGADFNLHLGRWGSRR